MQHFCLQLWYWSRLLLQACKLTYINYRHTTQYMCVIKIHERVGILSSQKTKEKICKASHLASLWWTLRPFDWARCDGKLFQFWSEPRWMMDWSAWKRQWRIATVMTPLLNSSKLTLTMTDLFIPPNLTFPLLSPSALFCDLSKTFLLHSVFQEHIYWPLTLPWPIAKGIYCCWLMKYIVIEIPCCREENSFEQLVW